MSDAFDPYYEWFGIPPEDQPPHHYRLLGIAKLESNPRVIETAAEQRMLLLKSRQTGKNAAFSQRLLNEVAQAQRTLLDPVRKKAYDAELTTGPVAAEVLSAVVPIEEEDPLAAALVTGSPQLRSGSQKRQSGNQMLLILAGGAVVGVLLLLGLLVALNSGGAPEVAATNPDLKTVPPATKPSVDLAPEQKKSPAAGEVKTEAKEKADPESSPSSGEKAATAEGTIGSLAELFTPAAADGEMKKSSAETPSSSQPPSTSPITPADAPPIATPPAIRARIPLPDESDIKQQRTKLKELLSSEYAKTTKDEGRIALGRKLVQLARESRGDDAEYAAILLDGQSYAAQGGDWKTALQCTDLLADRFEYDPWPAATEAFAKSLAKKRSLQEEADFLWRLVRFAERLMEADRLLPAGKLLVDAEKPIKTFGEERIRERAETLRARGSQWYREYKVAKESLDQLATAPDDAAANLVAGKYYAFTRGEWRRGLALLAKGDDAELAQLAKWDLELPREGKDQHELADNWWKVAASLVEPQQTQVQLRAGQWYREALAALTGNDRDKAEERVRELGRVGLLLRERPQFEEAPTKRDVVYLDDLEEEVHSVHGGTLGRHGDSGMRRDWEISDVIWDGRRPGHALFMHPHQNGPGVVVYNTQCAYRRFQSTVGLSTNTAGQSRQLDGDLRFQVYGDGELLWESQAIRSRGQQEEINLDISQVENLRLVTRFHGSNAASSWATWHEPRLEGCKWPLQPVSQRWKREWNEVWLDDLTPLDCWVGWRFMARRGSTTESFPSPIRYVKEGEVRQAHSLLAVPSDNGASVCRFALERRYERFTARVGVPARLLQEPHEFETLTFLVIVDGKVKWESRPISRAEEFQEVVVSVKDAQELRLEARCAGAHANALAVWIDPRLERPVKMPTKDRIGKLQRADRVVVWNAFNGDARDRGVARFNMQMYRGQELVWQQAGIRLEWDGATAKKTEVSVPALAFDRLRIEVTDIVGHGAALAEVQIFSGSKNLALDALVTMCDGRPDGNPKDFSALALIDGNTDSSRHGFGYMCSLDAGRPWIDFEFLPAPAGKPHPELGYALGTHPSSALEFQGHYYQVFSGTVSFEEAQRRCRNMGGYLACLETPEENRFVNGFARQHNVLIGLRTISPGQWQWINGAKPAFLRWADGEPSNSDGGEDVGELRFLGYWNDVKGTRGSGGFLCEWEK